MPARRSSKNRLRHLLTICRGMSSLSAMRLLVRPSAANRMILDLMTWKYDDVYCLAIPSRVCFSSSAKIIVKGLLLSVRTFLRLIIATTLR